MLAFALSAKLRSLCLLRSSSPMNAHEKAASDAALRQLLDDAVAAVHAAEGSILLLSEEGEDLRFVLSHSPVAEKLLGVSQPLGKGITGLAMSLQQPMIVNETQRSAAFDDTVDERTGVTTKAIMVIPLVTPHDEFGALTAINSTTASGFTADDLERYSDFAEQICDRLTALDLGMGNVGTFE